MGLPEYIGRYVVRREIARGAFATVALAWDDELRSEVAIKVLDGGDPEFRARFVEEARLLRLVRSHAVVGVYDVGRLGDGRPYIVMDHADEGTLTQKVARAAVGGGTGLALDAVVELVDAVADGLSAIHRAGVVHRDLKPDNVLYQSVERAPPSDEAATQALPVAGARASRVMIADLGIAKDLAARGSRATLIGGTPAFRAPEQMDPEAEVTPAADLYAASGMLWYALRGVPPPPAGELEAGLRGLPEPWWPVFRRGLDPDPAERFDAAEAWHAAAQDAMAAEAAARPAAAGTTAARLAPRPAECPYLGLGAFQLEDADRFFGREALVDELLGRLRARRVLVVGGPSGSGKSSVVRAGLVAGLRRGEVADSEGWAVEVFTPGRDAMAELYYRLGGGPGIALADFAARPTLARQVAGSAGPGGRVLVVDQFEELFTLNPPGEAARVAEALAALTDPADSAVRVVLAIRADFYAACASIPWLAEAITRNQVLVGPMTRTELRRAVVEPARLAGVYLERSLVDTIVDEAGSDAGSLPLVSHALVETWARRKGAALTLEGYRATGGVAGAIRQTADSIYDERLDDEGRATARRLLLSLVTPGEGTADSRRILDRAELTEAPDAEGLLRVVDLMAEARLLTVDDRTVQIAHEALLRSWPRLVAWIAEARADLLVRLRLVRRAEEWEAAGRDEELLLRGGSLSFAQEWLERPDRTVGALERGFVEAAIAARERAEEAGRRRAARSRRRRAASFAALALLAAGTSVASFLAITSTRIARENEARAEAATAVADERFAAALGAVALGQATEDPLLSLGLAAQSIARAGDTASTYDARAAMVAARKALTRGAPILAGGAVGAGDALSVAMSPDGRFVAIGRRDGSLALVDARTRRPAGPEVSTDIGGLEDLGFDPTGEHLVAVGNRGALVAWPVSDGLLGPAIPLGESPDILWGAALSPDGGRVATAGEDGAIRLWDLAGEGGEVVFDHEGDFTSVAFAPDGRTLVAGSGAGELFGWALPGGAALFGPVGDAHSSDVWELAFDPDGTRFATVSSDGTAAMHSFPDGRLLGRVFPDDVRIGSMAFMRDGRALLGGGADGRLHVWSLDDRVARAVSGVGHSGAIVDVAVDARGRMAASLGRDQLLRLWVLEPARPLARALEVPGGRAKGVDLGPGALVAGDAEGNVLARAGSDLRVVATHGHEVWAVALSPDGRQLASADRGGGVRVGGPDGGGAAALDRPIDGAVWSVRFRGDGSQLLTAADTGLALWDLPSLALARRFDAGGLRITRADLSPKEDRIAAATETGEALVWDVASDEPPRRIEVARDLVWTVRFASDGRHLLAGTGDEVVSVWDLEAGRKVAELTGHGGGVTDLLPLGDGATVVAADRRGDLHLWDLVSRRRIGRIEGAHSASVWRLAASPGGRVFASAGDDGMVRVWDVLSARAACEISRSAFDPERRAQYLGTPDAHLPCDAIPGAAPGPD